jgi:hypothetical protein
MEVSTDRDWSGDNDARGVDGLEYAFEMTLARYFLDENGRQALGAKFLVHAEIVDFADRDNAAESMSRNRYMKNREIYFFRTRSIIGTPEMKAMSFLLEVIRTPICHSWWYPGGVSALSYRK